MQLGDQRRSSFVKIFLIGVGGEGVEVKAGDHKKNVDHSSKYSEHYKHRTTNCCLVSRRCLRKSRVCSRHSGSSVCHSQKFFFRRILKSEIISQKKLVRLMPEKNPCKKKN